MLLHMLSLSELITQNYCDGTLTVVTACPDQSLTALCNFGKPLKSSLVRICETLYGTTSDTSATGQTLHLALR